jgi:hypothetical protein
MVDEDDDSELVHSDAPPHANVQYKAVAGAEEHLLGLRALYSADKKAERLKNTFGTFAVLGFVSAVIGVFIGAFAEIGAAAYWVAVGVAGAGGIAGAIAASFFGKNDVDDRKLDAALRVFEVIGPELKATRKAAVWIDFKGADRTKPISNDTSFFNATGTKVFKKPEWLRLRFTLLDGTALRVTASTTIKRKQRAKRKYTKVKDKVSDELIVQVKAPAGSQLSATAAEELAKRFVGRQGMSLKSVRIKPRVAQLVFRTVPAQRTRARAGWSGFQLDRLLDGPKVLDAVIFSYKATAAAGAQQAA